MTTMREAIKMQLICVVVSLLGMIFSVHLEDDNDLSCF